MNRYRRFTGQSEHESKEIIRKDRGAVSRCIAWFAGLGTNIGIGTLANILPSGSWGSSLVVASQAGMVFLAADAVASVAEIAVNATNYKNKKKAVFDYLKSSKKADVDLYSTLEKDKEDIKEVLNRKIEHASAFESKFADILKQIYVDFIKEPKYDTIRSVLKEKSLSDEQILAIQNSVNENGKVTDEVVKDIVETGRLGDVLGVIACDDFSDRIVDNFNNENSRFTSRIHLKGCLTLTADQQRKNNIRLTPEQLYVYRSIKKQGLLKGLFGISKRGFKNKLAEINEKILAGDMEAASVMQEKLLNQMTDRKIVDTMDTLVGGRVSAKKLKNAIKDGAKSTSEHSIANWLRHIFPITKKIGGLLNFGINPVVDKIHYRGDFKKHKDLKKKLEKETHLKFSDVHCQNGTGFKDIRKKFRKANFHEIITLRNKNREDSEFLPQTLASVYVKDESKFEKTKSSLFEILSKVKSSAHKIQKNGRTYCSTVYLDEPVVVNVIGNYNKEEKNTELPLGSFNIDHKAVLHTVLEGIVQDIAEGNLKLTELNHIEIKSGSRTRTIYLPQIQQAVSAYREKKNFASTALMRTVENISQNETFWRVLDMENGSAMSYDTLHDLPIGGSEEDSEEEIVAGSEADHEREIGGGSEDGFGYVFEEDYIDEPEPDKKPKHDSVVGAEDGFGDVFDDDYSDEKKPKTGIGSKGPNTKPTRGAGIRTATEDGFEEIPEDDNTDEPEPDKKPKHDSGVVSEDGFGDIFVDDNTDEPEGHKPGPEKPGPDPKPGTEKPGPEPDPKPGPNKPGPEPDPKPGTEKPGPESDPKPGPEPDPKPGPESDPKPGPEPAPKPGTEKPGPEPDPKPGPEGPKPDPKPGTEKPGPEPDPKPGPNKPGPEPDPKPGTEKPGPESDPKPGPESAPKPGPEPDPKPGPEGPKPDPKPSPEGPKGPEGPEGPKPGPEKPGPEGPVRKKKIKTLDDLEKLLKSVQKLKEKNLVKSIPVMETKTKDQQDRTKIVEEVSKLQKVLTNKLGIINDLIDEVELNATNVEAYISEAREKEEQLKEDLYKDEKFLTEFDDIYKTLSKTRREIKKTFEKHVVPIANDPLNLPSQKKAGNSKKNQL